MHQRIWPLLESIEELRNNWTGVMARWKALGLSESEPHARLHGASIQDFNKRLILTFEQVGAIGKLDDASQALFLPKIDLMRLNVTAASSAATSLLNELNAYPAATYVLTAGSLDNVQVIQSGASTTTYNFGAYFEQMSGAFAALFDLSASAVRLGKSKVISVYAGHVEALQGVTAELQKLLAVAKDGSSEQANLVALARDFAKVAADLAEQAKESHTDIFERALTAKSGADEIDAKLAAVRETATAAAVLQKQVDGYQASFLAFQASLDENVRRHDELVNDTSSAVAKNLTRETEINRLIEKSDSMISGSTTAGLGHSLEKTRLQYEQSRNTARLMFFGSVALLAFSAVPLVAQVLPGLFVGWVPAVTASQSPQSGGEAMLSLMGKMFLLFPATWLTQFCSKSYSEFFHLEREYAHKAALARSVEGFKKQAPKYEEEITTAVFLEVQSNPSKQKAPEAAEHPFLGLIVRKLGESWPLGKGSETKT